MQTRSMTNKQKKLGVGNKAFRKTGNPYEIIRFELAEVALRDAQFCRPREDLTVVLNGQFAEEEEQVGWSNGAFAYLYNL